MTALGDDLEALLDAERDIDVPAPAQRQRMFARLEPLLLVPAALATATTATTATTAASSGVIAGAALPTKLVASVVFAAVIGGAVGAGGHAYFATPQPAAVAPAVPGDPTPKSVPAPSPLTEPAAESPAKTARSAPAPSADATPSAPRTEERTQSAGSLRAERLLIETASAALVRGDSKSAIAALRQHARSYPKGALAEEREVLLVKALAASGDDAAAEKRAKEFKKKFPGSMQQGSVDDARAK
jgi:hypothetical protein